MVKEIQVMEKTIEKAIECYKEYSYDAETGVGITDAHYCPNCGAEMSKRNIE